MLSIGLITIHGEKMIDITCHYGTLARSGPAMDYAH